MERLPESKRAAEPALLELRSKVPATLAGLPLVDYLCRRFPYLTRQAWLAEIARGRLHVAGRRASAEQLLATGAAVTFFKEHLEPVVDRAITLLHRGADFVAAAKPAHLPMHADGPFVRHTFVHLLGEQLGGAKVHLVHRLDRETSGVVIAALTGQARAWFGAQFEGGQVQKTYLAVVRGTAAASQFVVDAPIGRRGGSEITLRRTAGPDAVEPQAASTEFEVLAERGGHSLVRCRPRTGRTHQIRVHLEHAGLPIVGDKLYGRPDADYLAFVQRVKAGGDARDVPAGEPDRQLLHAHALQLLPHGANAATTFVAPPPADFREWLQRLQLGEPPPA
ncbi:MAG: RluA family pseudouridine synthase [Planctomycetes bacterium]|nr:RluA family pseudouridine synthase [Planctomycetota bacterium]